MNRSNTFSPESETFIPVSQAMLSTQAGINAQQSSLDDDFIDISKLLHAVLRYKWGILGFSLLFGLVSAMYVSTIQPVYRASASILLESQDANLVGVEDIYAMSSRGYDYYYTQFEMLKSRYIAERVVRKLELHKQAQPQVKEQTKEQAKEQLKEQPKTGFSLTSLLPAREQSPPEQLTEEDKVERAIDRQAAYVAGGLIVEPVEYTHMAYISFNSTNPKLAAQIVNTVGEEFIVANLESRVEGTLQATGWLTERLEGLQDNLRDSEQALHNFREREGLVHVKGETNLGGNELNILAQRLDDARRARVEAQNIKEDVQQMPGATTEELMVLPAVLRHDLVSVLKQAQSEAERKVAELEMRYGIKHPKMIAASSDLQVANKELAFEVKKVVSGISREYQVALRNEQQLQASWEERKDEMQDFNRIEFELLELQREVETNRQLYDIFFTRIRGVSEGGGFEKPHARIIDEAKVPRSPHSPNVKRSATLAATVGLIIGMAIAILLEFLDNTIKRPDDVQEQLGVPLLGMLPREKLDGEGAFPVFWENSLGHYAESIRSIRTGVLLSELDNPEKIILVTSTVPGEGKSTVVLNLGSALGQMERTLLIGADLRRPGLAKKCGIAADHPGLSHFVSGVASLEECITELKEPGIWVMPAGVIPPNPLEMISSKAFSNALDSLKQQYDRILIDSAPVQAVSDALVLASYSDAVVYVVKADATPANAARKGINSILGTNPSLNGVVLNQLDTQKTNSYYKGGYYKHGNYYQTEEA